jgi:hypothetical protein
MRTLRGRLILSHILPIVLIVPLVGVLLAYLLETQVLLAGLSERLVDQATMAAGLARQQPAVWRDAHEARRFVAGTAVRSTTWVMLYDPDGNLLASNAPTQTSEASQTSAALAGQEQVEVIYVQGVRVVQVLVPVAGPVSRSGRRPHAAAHLRPGRADHGPAPADCRGGGRGASWAFSSAWPSPRAWAGRCSA